MPQPITLFNCTVSVWMLAWNLGHAQSVASLSPQPDSLRHIAAEEKQALVHNDSLRLAEAWFRYGKIYERSGNFRASQNYFLRSLRIIEPRGDSPELSRLYARLSNYEVIQHNHSKALEYARRSLTVAQYINDKLALIRAYNFLGKAYEVGWRDQSHPQALLDSMVLCYRRSESLCYQTGDTLGVAEANIILGEVLLETQGARAIPYLEKSLQLYTLKKKEGMLPNVLVALSAAYLTAGQADLARQTLGKAEKAYLRMHRGDIDILIKIADVQAAYFEQTRQWQHAFNYTRKANALKQKKLQADRKGAIGRLAIEYETEKKEDRIRVQNVKLRIQQQFTALTSVLLLLTAGLSLVFYRLYRQNQRTSRRNVELVREQNHRVKNNLQVVSSLLSLQADQLTDEAAKRAVEDSQLRVQAMAILHRRLYDGEYVARVDQGEFIQELVGAVLQTFGYTTDFVQFDLSPFFLPADKAIPLGLILNELTTNACKYAFPLTQSPLLLVRCHRQGRTVRLRVADNGPGLGGEHQAINQTSTLLIGQGKTFGTTLIQAQVAQLNGRGQYEADPQSGMTSGTIFTLEFTA